MIINFFILFSQWLYSPGLDIIDFINGEYGVSDPMGNSQFDLPTDTPNTGLGGPAVGLDQQYDLNTSVDNNVNQFIYTDANHCAVIKQEDPAPDLKNGALAALLQAHSKSQIDLSQFLRQQVNRNVRLAPNDQILDNPN